MAVHAGRTTPEPNRPARGCVRSRRDPADSPAAGDTRRAPLGRREMCRQTPSWGNLAGGLQRFELAAIHEEIEELRVCFQTAMLNSSNKLFELPALGLGEQRDGGPFNRGVADLRDTVFRDAGNQADPRRGLRVHAPPETARQVDNGGFVEFDSVVAENHPQTRVARP